MNPDNPFSYPVFPEESSSPLTVKDMPADEQPRERLLKYGISSLTTADLFAIILRTGTKGYPITDICRDLMRMNDNHLLDLARKTREQIMEMKGIGQLKAMQIEAVMEIVRRYCREKIGERVRIKTAQDAYELMRYEIGNLPYEEMWVIFLNRSQHVIGKMRVSEGGTRATLFDVKKVIRSAIYAHAEALILCHNHPSGNSRPSPQDDKVTTICRKACDTVELNLLDHLIITPDSYYSYSQNTDLLS